MLTRVALVFVLAAAHAVGAMRAGAARMDITPPRDAALRMSGYDNRAAGFTGIHDPLYVRAIVIDDGSMRAAIVSADLSAISGSLWQSLTSRIEKETGIKRGAILLAATHTHAGPALGRATADDFGDNAKEYASKVADQFVAAVKAAQAALQPARIGAGAGKVNVNVNRAARVPKGGFHLGRNPDGPSDKTLAVVKIETLSGTPIAVFMNYAVHATVMGPKNLKISGDLAGATSRSVEQHFGGNVVAPWTSGAAGDQAPIYNKAEMPEEAYLIGQLIAEEAIRVAGTIRTSGSARIVARQKTVSCAGRKMQGDTPVDAPPVEIRLSLLRVNHIAFAGVSAEVLVGIGTRLKAESPLRHTIFVSNANGYVGYLPNDEAFQVLSYETRSSAVKPGCAENAIVNGFLDLMDEM